MPIFVESGYFRQNHHLLFNAIQLFMKKTLLTLAAGLMAMSAVAQAPTAEELSAYSVRVDWAGDSINYPTVGKAIVTYPTEGSTASIRISEPTGVINLTAKYDAAAGELSMYPQMAGMDEDTYQYRMIVPASVKTLAPTDSKFSTATIGGHIFSDAITFGPWNMILTSNFTDNAGVVYATDINTVIYKPNCTVTLGKIEEDDANDYVYKKGEVLELRAYAEQDMKRLTVYNFDEMGGCLVLNLDNNEACTVPSGDVVYKNGAKRVYKSFALDASTIGGYDAVKAANPDAAGTIEDGKVIKLGSFGLLNTVRTGDRGLYYEATITLDNSLDIISGIADTQVPNQVASVSYANLAGMVSAEPFSGVNVKITRYTDGSISAEKVIVRK